MTHHKQRWIFSPLDEKSEPVARDYAVQWSAPFYYNGFALTLCLMNSNQLIAARKDPRLIVLGSIHESTPVDKKIIDHHAEHGAKDGMRLHELLLVLASLHPGFEPEV